MEACEISPSVSRRNGLKVEKVPSLLYKDIKNAVGDRDTAWKLWAYTKTTGFKTKHPNVSYDENGEVTFPSLIRSLGIEDVVNKNKNIAGAIKQYGFDRSFPTMNAALEEAEAFNMKEKKFIAIVEKENNVFKVNVLKRTGTSINQARNQSFNKALSNEIVSLMRSLGFDVGFINNPKYAGLFDPENAELVNGFWTVIRIAKGERGEDALPEEFAHMMIEGLAGNPLVIRLLDSLTNEDLQEVLGDRYNAYFEEYNGDIYRLKKEVAGQLLAEYITKKGTLRQDKVEEKKGLLSRIWNWAKKLFSKISNKDIESVYEKTNQQVSQIFNLITLDNIGQIIDRSEIMTSQSLASLDTSNMEKMTSSLNAQLSKIYTIERGRSKTKMAGKPIYEAAKQASKHFDEDNYLAVVKDYARGTLAVINGLKERIKDIQVEFDKITKISELKPLGQLIVSTNETVGAVKPYLEQLSMFETFTPSELQSLGISEETAEAISQLADGCLKELKKVESFANKSKLNFVIAAARTEVKHDIVRGIGDKRDEIMSIAEIAEHAERDINFADRFLTAMSDADDVLLQVVDSIVKSQKYDRDIIVEEERKHIALWDKQLREAGYTSEFMLEKNADGEYTMRIISPYDWDGYNKALREFREQLEEVSKDMKPQRRATYIAKQIETWKAEHLTRIYVDPDLQREYERTGKQQDGVYEVVPNLKYFNKYANKIESLPEVQRKYYYNMMDLKRRWMAKIPHRGQKIYKVINISKDMVESILDTNPKDVWAATADNLRRRFIRRPDDIGFGETEDFREDILNILRNEKNSENAANQILEKVEDYTEEDVHQFIHPGKIKNMINLAKRRIEKGEIEEKDALEKLKNDIIDFINMQNFFIVDTDFANHTIQKLPIYYSRNLRHKEMLSTDFSAAMTAYTAMAVNYVKMDEVVDILEVLRYHIKNDRDIKTKVGDRAVQSQYTAFTKTFRNFVTKAGSNSNIADRLDDYMASAVYEERKKNEGTVHVPFLGDVDFAASLDAIKDYTGLLALGFNLFSTISNLAVGKIQQWIEAVGGEYFDVKDYAKAVGQYSENIAECLLEMGSPLKKNKLSLLIEMFDPMGEYFESLRNPSYSKNIVSRILGGDGALAYIGMNAGEHILHCQTMLAILNHTKLKDQTTGEEISLYDALEVVEGKDGIYRLELKDGLSYERDKIDNTGKLTKDANGRIISSTNPNYGKPVKDENGKIVTETIKLKGGRIDKDEVTKEFIKKKKRIIRKVNDSLNGAFSADDKGAAHRWAIFRLIMQFRQWMPAHYERRFAGEHYDLDLERWREGFYVTSYKLLRKMYRDIEKGEFEWGKIGRELNEHEKANLRRAATEVSLFLSLLALIKIGGRVKDRDRSWLNKMALYQIHRMYLEIGASTPLNPLEMFSNFLQLVQKPMGAIDTLQKFKRIIEIQNIFDEVQTGRYQGWSEWQRDLFKMLPAAAQILKAYDFDDSLFSQWEKD